ncbi:MAG TPA: hypothetical protein VHH11_05275 [Gammaproteobacteria bacterium]|jgi:hypothetical protein|nr:hypothetical protein [Gammaproteobacteria bacterium]
MSNFKSQAKRKRELAKLDKRHAKDQKRALRKAERSGTETGAAAATIAGVARPMPAHPRTVASTPAAPKPLTLAEAAERWKNTKIVTPKRR